MFPSPSGEGSGDGQFFCFVISKWHILVNNEVLNLKYFLSWPPSVGFGSILWQMLDFRAKQWIKDIIKCCRWAGTTNIVCYIRKYVIIFGDILIDVPQPKYWGMCPRHPRRGWCQWHTVEGYCRLRIGRQIMCHFKILLVSYAYWRPQSILRPHNRVSSHNRVMHDVVRSSCVWSLLDLIGSP